MLKNTLAVALILSILTSQTNVFADELPIAQSTITSLKQGQVAPFQGVLLSPHAVAEITVKLDSVKETVKIEVDKCLAEREAQIRFLTNDSNSKLEQEKSISSAKLESKEKQIIQLQSIVKKQENSNSSSTTWITVGIIGGMVGGIALTSLAVYVVNVASK